jgi:hypothetical protein
MFVRIVPKEFCYTGIVIFEAMIFIPIVTIVGGGRQTFEV